MDFAWSDPIIYIAFLIGFILAWIIEWLWDNRKRQQDLTAYEDDTAELYEALERSNHAKSAAQKEAASVLARADGLQEQKQVVEQDLQKLKTEHAALHEQFSNHDVKLRQLAATEQANEALLSKLSIAENRIRDLEGVQQSLAQRSEEVSQVRSELDATSQRVDTLLSEKQMLRDKLAATETELATMSATYSTKSEDFGEMDSLRSRHDEAQGEIERLKANLATLTAQSERLSSTKRENNDLHSRLESAENELLNEHNRLVASEVKLQNMADQLTDERMRSQVMEQELESLRRQATSSDDVAALQDELSSKKRVIEQLRSDLTSAKLDGALINTLKAENEELRSKFYQQEVDPEATVPLTAPVMFSSAGKPDRLQDIKGIGNVFAQRLNDAGITTFAEVAQLTPERLAELVQAKEFQSGAASSWIDQAQQLAGSREA